MALGEFAVGELLLASGETLSVTLTPGVLQAPNGGAMPYDVSFSPPTAFDGSQSGEAFDVAIELDADAFHSATAGTYTAALVFRVISHPANVTVWQKATVLTVVKPQSIGKEGVPSTGILTSELYFWCAAVLAVVLCVVLILRAAIRKAKKRKETAREEAASPIRSDNDSSPTI
jgi:hypothetical protein